MILDKDLQSHITICGSIQLTCTECHLIYNRSDAPLHTETRCLREPILQRDAVYLRLRTDFDNYQNQQMEIMKRLQEQTTIFENLNRRFDAICSRMSDGKSSMKKNFSSTFLLCNIPEIDNALLSSANLESKCTDILDHIEATVHEQDITAQNINTRVSELSFQILNCEF